MLDKKAKSRKPKCRCFINASYGRAFSKGTSGVKDYKPCPMHEIQEKEKGTMVAAEKDFRSWVDLSEEEQEIFGAYILSHNIQGWEELQDACEGFGFVATEDIPTVYELRKEAKC